MLPAIVAGGAALMTGLGALAGMGLKNADAERKLQGPPNPNDPIFGSRTKQLLEQQSIMGR